MKLGVTTQGFVGRNGDAGVRIREVVKEAELADEVGLHSFSVSEQHFKYPTNSTGAIDVVLTAVAQATQNIRIRPGVVILPLHHPLNVAERWAAIDVLSNGRVDFGIGRGNTPLTAEAFEIPVPETEPRTVEALKIVLGAWFNPAFDYDGTYYKIAPIALTPKPVQLPHPPLFWAATSPPSHELGGKLGLGLLTGANAIHWDQAERRIQRYRAGVTAAEPLPGVTMTPQVVMHINGHCASSFAEAKAQVEDYVVGYVNRTVDMYEEFVRRSGRNVGFDRAKEFKDNFDMIVHSSPSAFGTPEDVIGSLARIHAMGVDEVDVLYDGATHEEHLECIRLLGTEVAPAVASWPEHDHRMAGPSGEQPAVANSLG